LVCILLDDEGYVYEFITPYSQLDHSISVTSYNQFLSVRVEESKYYNEVYSNVSFLVLNNITALPNDGFECEDLLVELHITYCAVESILGSFN